MSSLQTASTLLLLGYPTDLEPPKYHPITWEQCGLGSSVSIATGYGLDGPGIESRWGVEIFRTCPDRPWGPQASCTMGAWSFPGVKGVKLTPHPLLVPWSWEGRVIPLLPLWAVWPVQSLSACTRVHLTLLFTREQSILCSLSIIVGNILVELFSSRHSITCINSWIFISTALRAFLHSHCLLSVYSHRKKMYSAFLLYDLFSLLHVYNQIYIWIRLDGWGFYWYLDYHVLCKNIRLVPYRFADVSEKALTKAADSMVF